MRRRVQFYIMSARSLFNNRKANVAQVAEEWKGFDSTILVCSRAMDNKWEPKPVPIYLLGSGSPKGDNYNMKIGDRPSYIIDTGNGHRDTHDHLVIENIIYIKKDGSIRSLDENHDMKERRHVWVMK